MNGMASIGSWPLRDGIIPNQVPIERRKGVDEGMDGSFNHPLLFGPFGCFFIDAQRTVGPVCHLDRREDTPTGRLVCTEQSRSQSLVFGLSTFELHWIEGSYFFYFPLSFIPFFSTTPWARLSSTSFQKYPFWVWKSAALLSPVNRHLDRSADGRYTPFTPSPISFFLRVICDTTLNFWQSFQSLKFLSHFL